MEYRIERYKNCERFNEQYQSIYQFLLEAEKLDYNEHFHWGTFRMDARTQQSRCGSADQYCDVQG